MPLSEETFANELPVLAPLETVEAVAASNATIKSSSATSSKSVKSSSSSMMEKGIGRRSLADLVEGFVGRAGCLLNWHGEDSLTPHRLSQLVQNFYCIARKRQPVAMAARLACWNQNCPSRECDRGTRLWMVAVTIQREAYHQVTWSRPTSLEQPRISTSLPQSLAANRVSEFHSSMQNKRVSRYLPAIKKVVTLSLL